MEEAYFDLGTHARAITTTSAEAQRWFDRGLVWAYAFNHEEAIRCFENAAAADPGCAMAHWGIAYSLGPNYNKPWEMFDDAELARSIDRAHHSVDEAKARLTGATPTERRLVTALDARYPEPATGDPSMWNAQYADAMGSVYASAPDDLDVAALYAESLMNLTPWQLWDITTGEPAAGASTVEAAAVLERALHGDAALVHPGILHMYVHLMEMSPQPERAQVIADRLRGLVPDAGHLQHMPSHLDVLCGDYRQAVAANTAAIRADQKYVARAGAMNFYTLYRCHDLHFKIYAAMFLGQQRTALDAVAGLEHAIPEELLRLPSPPMADWLEGFLAMRLHVYIRFGRWDELLAMPAPADAQLYCVTTAMLHYARGIAFSRPDRLTRRPWNATASVPPCCVSPTLVCCSTTPAGTSWPLPRPCSTVNSSTGKDSTRSLTPRCAGPSSWTTPCPTTSHGPGCSRPGMRSGRYYSNRDGRPRPKGCIARTSASIRPSPVNSSTPATSGHWSACTSAWSRYERRAKLRSSRSNSHSLPH